LRISFYNDWFMSAVRQILVVDDHFEMLEYLQSMLAIVDADCQVLGVPSAEEACLELRRRPFDLLITDQRLPGMSGLELVRQAQQWWPNLPVIMLTAYGSAQGKKEAADLGVQGYFGKPPDTDALLTRIRSALSREERDGGVQPEKAPAVSPSSKSPLVPIPAEAVAQDIDRRLQNLRTDTGAVQVVLASIIGEVLFASGPDPDMDASRLARIVASGLESSFALAVELESAEPFTFQYQPGGRYDLYAANIGRRHFLLLLLDVQVRRGRIGTVWVYTQRAIKQLGNLLDDIPTDLAETAPSNPLAPAGSQQTGTERLPETGPLTKPMNTPPQPAGTVPADPLVELLTAADQEKMGDLEAFWTEALADETTGEHGDGLSFEEALQQGLIPPQFGKTTDES
jgi:DNA-binding response OmpR family regulator